MLRVTSLEANYSGIRALRGVSLEVKTGEMVALIGPNGAGKSTLLNCLSGIVPPAAGSILLDGQECSGERPWTISRRGLLHCPEGRQILPEMTVLENLQLGLSALGTRPAAYPLERVYSLFPILQERAMQLAGSLSGGQQQMLAIGRALMGRPKMLLLDEPSMGLAPLLVEEVFNVVKTLKSQGMTIFLVEQNAFAALAIADRGYVLETGSVTLTGTGQELIANEQVRAAYLGM